MNKTLVIIVLVIVIMFIILKKTTSSLAPAPVASANSTLSLPVYDTSGNYQDVNISVAGNAGFLNNITLDTGRPSWAEANQKCWDTTNCYGIRHNFDTKQTWYLTKDPTGKTATSVLSVLTPTVPYNGTDYSLPLAIVALKSVSDPATPINCEWAENIPACVTPACGVSGTPVSTTWTKSKEASRTGTCAPAPSSRSVSCPNGPPCPVNCVWTENTPACVIPKCNTPGTPVSTTWAITTPAANGGTCAASPAPRSVACAAGSQCPWVPFTSLTGGVSGSPVSSPAPAPAGSPSSLYTLVTGANNDIAYFDVLPGGDNKNTVEECEAGCTSSPNCASFMFSSNPNLGTIYRNQKCAYKVSQIPTGVNSITGTKLYTKKMGFTQVTTGNNINGNDIPNGDAYTSFNDCKTGCDNLTNCGSFIYSMGALGGAYGAKRCAFKTTKTADNTIQNGAGIAMYAKNSLPAPAPVSLTSLKYEFVGEGGCTNDTTAVRATCRTKAGCNTIGQQSNGCWHCLKTAATGPNAGSGYTMGLFAL